ncbi:ABC transporter permease [Oceanisphaera avium]|uniref:ABC transporter n=1 Tax=Oceanisphaera avium TaxID=1903694 RepID=A0A1Y0D120_9GAMM|nr:ABC transporter permease subunit [Oceanisphaera avium]ART81024.1 ABC transporter [Oceanisphaera avium]
MLDLKGYESSLLQGASLTLSVALLSLVLAVTLGLLGALAKLSSFRLARLLATFYTTVIRGIPDLVLMMLLFFGGQVLLNNALLILSERLTLWFGQAKWLNVIPEYIELSPFIAGVLTIGFIFGAYMTETFRGAILAVDAKELEAARAYGMSQAQVLRRILLPQMMRHALPGLGNNWLVQLKTTALVSIIGLDDMVRKASLAAGATQLPFTFYMAVALTFLLFTAVSSGLLKWLERHYSLHLK